MKILSLLLAILPLAVGDVFTIRTLEKINSEDSPVLRVCFDGHLTTDLNTSEFKLQISNNFTQTVVPSVSVVSEQCQMFKINLEHYSGPTSFLLTLQNRLAGKSETLGHGSVTVTLKNINFTGVWIGNSRVRQDRRSVRIQHDYKASRREKLKASLVGLDTEKVFNCKSSPCYLVEVEYGHRYHEVQLCLSNVASTDTKGCQVCERKAPENSKEQFILDLPELDSLVLTYGKNGKPYISVAGPFDDATASLEIVLYRGEGKTYHLISAACNATTKGGSKLCRSPNIFRLSGQGQYKVLLVALDQDGKVTHSSVSSFENFATKVVQLSSDFIEVQWKAAERGVYEVSLDQDVPGRYNNVTVHCGGTNSSSCSAYFTKLDQKTYEVEVKKNDNACNAVARVTTLQEEIREHLRVFSVLHGISNTPDHTNLTVCIEETIDSHSYDVILIDRWGTTLRTRSNLKGSHILCFPPVALGSGFDASREVRILVKAEIVFQSFFGDSELFLLGLSQSDGNKMLTVDQVGMRTVRVKWLNLNDGQVAIGNVFSLTEASIVRSVDRISCQYRDECGKYLHFVGKTVSFQITEMAENLQIVHAQMHFADILPIKIISSTIDWAGRVKVCFHEVKEAHRYELGLELDHSTLIDDTRYPETISSGDRQLCLLSQSQIDAGPDSSVTVIVSGLDSGGTLLAAGNDVLKVNFISSSRTILAASAMDGIMASWGHMVPLRNNEEEYRVSFKTLGLSKEQQTDVMVAEKQLFRRFPEEGRSDFAICVRPREKVPKAFNGEACSDIIHSTDVSARPVPSVEEVKLRTASAEAILVTWKPPTKEDVSSYVVSWNLEYFGDDDELPAADRLLYVLPASLVSGEFKILPAGQISLTLHNLKDNSRYLVCVAAVKKGIMGQKTCGVVDLDAYYPLSYPLDVKYKKGIVLWNGKMNCTCHVEWKSLTEGTSEYTEVEGNSYELDLGPGVWEITVRNVTGEVASGPSKIRVSVEGIVISTKQTGQASLTIKWSENKKMPSMKAYNATIAYEVTFSKGGKPLDSPTVKRCCGRMEDCSVQFTNKLIYPNDEISVNVFSLNSSNSARAFHRIRAIEKIKSLSAKMAGSDSAKVTWDKVYEAKRYNYILYNNQKSQKRIILSGSQPENYSEGRRRFQCLAFGLNSIFNSIHLQINIPELEGCIFEVQVCIGEDTCGDFNRVALTETNENNIIFSFEVAIAAAAFFVLLIAFAFRKKSSGGQTGRDRQLTRTDARRIRKTV